jgi:mannose-1-phosphate guanylyltransferase
MLHAVIMAGGCGTRFWPASRRSRPKQLLALACEQPLLRMTVDRIAPLVPAERLWVITTENHLTATRELLPDLPDGNIVAEPVGRNTAACAGLAAVAVRARDPEAVIVMLPADHVIGEEARFRSAVSAAAAVVARDGGLLTFGIRPTRPETGYGYLRQGPPHTEEAGWTVHRLEGFVEKPDAEHALAYLESGRYLWNAGIFCWRARDLLDEITRHLPEMAAGMEQIADAWGGARAAHTLAEVYRQLPATSVDFGIMERADRGWVMPVDFPWSDVGSWLALGDQLPSDTDGNATRGRVHAVDASGNVLVSDGPLIAALGVHDLVVVTTADAVLVVPKDQAQRVKELIDGLAERGWDDVL